MRRAMGDALMTAGSALVLVITLVAFDDQVRERASQLLSSSSTLTLAGVGYHLRDVSAILLASAHQQSLAHAPLLIFSLAGVVLVLFMLRT